MAKQEKKTPWNVLKAIFLVTVCSDTPDKGRFITWFPKQKRSLFPELETAEKFVIIQESHLTILRIWQMGNSHKVNYLKNEWAWALNPAKRYYSFVYRCMLGVSWSRAYCNENQMHFHTNRGFLMMIVGSKNTFYFVLFFKNRILCCSKSATML